MHKVLTDHFSWKIVDFRRFSRGYPKSVYMVSLQLSAATWLINAKTLPKDLNYSQHKFQEHHYWIKFFQISFRAKMSIFDVFDGGALRFGLCCHFSWARPHGWLIPKRFYKPQLFSTLVSGTSLMDKELSDHFSWKNVDFRHFSRGYPKFEYMVSLQLSAATWLINTKTLL